MGVDWHSGNMLCTRAVADVDLTLLTPHFGEGSLGAVLIATQNWLHVAH